jgi:hypothetical protein
VSTIRNEQSSIPSSFYLIRFFYTEGFTMNFASSRSINNALANRNRKYLLNNDLRQHLCIRLEESSPTAR